MSDRGQRERWRKSKEKENSNASGRRRNEGRKRKRNIERKKLGKWTERREEKMISSQKRRIREYLAFTERENNIISGRLKKGEKGR